MSNINIGDRVGVGDASKYENLRGQWGVVWRIRALSGQNEYEVMFRDKNGVGHARWIPESDLVLVPCHGERVRVNVNGHPVRHNAPIGSTGKILHSGPCESLVVEFDESIREGSRTTKTQFVSPADLEFVKATTDESAKTGWKVVITPDGDDTIAVLYNNEKMDRYAKVRRFHEDTYDKSVAAIEAVKKLFGKQEKPEPEQLKGFTGKAVFKGDGCSLDGFTIGRIYTFSDGLTLDDKQLLCPLLRMTDLDLAAQWIDDLFIKVVE